MSLRRVHEVKVVRKRPKGIDSSIQYLKRKERYPTMTLVDQIIEAVSQWNQQLEHFQNLNPQEGAKLSSLERAALELGRKVALISLQHSIKQPDNSSVPASFDCQCDSGRLSFQRMAERPVRTLVGEIRYSRPYYYCRVCGASRCPFDEELGQSRREISAGLERAFSLLSAHLPFSTATLVLEEIGSVSLTSRQVETVAEAVGEEADLLEQESARLAQQKGLVELVGAKAQHAERRVWILEMDGVMAPMRGGKSSEVKVGIIYELAERVEISKGRWELLQKQRCEVRGDLEEFRRRLWAMMVRVGVRERDRIVVIGDGAEWIDQTVEMIFIGATRIMNFYHMAERIWSVAGVRFGCGSKEGEKWAKEKLRLMKAGEVGRVIRALRQIKIEGAEGEAIRAEAVGYIRNNQEGMKYGQYRAEKLPIGSGAIEGSCKYLVTARCKQAGMRWSEKGIDAILALRCWVLNGRLNELRPKPAIEIEWAKAA